MRERQIGICIALQERPIVLDDAFERLPGQIETVVACVTALQQRHDAQRLSVVIEPAIGRHAGLERALAGVAERRMAEVMGERHGFREILIDAQRAGERAGDLPDLDRMGEAGAKMIAVERHEDLRLMREAAKGGAVDDSVAIALEFAPRRRWRLCVKPAARARGVAGVCRKRAANRHMRAFH